MKKIIFLVFVLICAFTQASITAFAQKIIETENGIEVEKNLTLVRRDLRAEKKKIIAENVPLTVAEADKFWPVYDQYTTEMSKHYSEFYFIIKDYAANQKTMTDEEAINMLKRWSTIQVNLTKTRQKFVPLIEKVIPGKKAALFFQVDRRLYSLMDLQVASEIPLVLQ